MAFKASGTGLKTETSIRFLINSLCSKGQFVPYESKDPVPKNLVYLINDSIIRQYNIINSNNQVNERALAQYNTDLSNIPDRDAPHILSHLTLDGWNEVAQTAFEYQGQYHYDLVKNNAGVALNLLRKQIDGEMMRDRRKVTALEKGGVNLIKTHCSIPQHTLCDYVISRLIDIDLYDGPTKTSFYMPSIPEPPVNKMNDIQDIISITSTDNVYSTEYSTSNHYIELLYNIIEHRINENDLRLSAISDDYHSLKALRHSLKTRNSSTAITSSSYSSNTANRSNNGDGADKDRERDRPLRPHSTSYFYPQ